jgi:hypothetical protein
MRDPARKEKGNNMTCPSCGRRSPLSPITQFFCSKCRSLLCRGCLTRKEGNLICPTCERNISSPGSAGFAFIGVIILLSMIIGMQSAITTVEDDLAWDSLEVVPFENAEDRSYIKIAGRIDSGSNITLDRVIHPNGAREWRVMDFNLTYGNASIFVNMSDFDTIARNDANDHPNGSYLDGDLVYVVGLVYYEGDNISILAYYVAYDTEIFDGLFKSYNFAAFTVVLGALPMTFILVSPPISRMLFPQLKRIIPTPQKDVPTSRADPKISDGPPAFKPTDPLPLLSRRIEKGVLISIVVLGISSLFGIILLIRLILDSENILSSIDVWNSFLSLLLFTLGSSFLYGIILSIYPNLLIHVEPTEFHLHYAFGFGPIQMMKWDTITEIERVPYGHRLTTSDNVILLFPIFNTTVRRDIERRAKDAINEREERELGI